MLAPFKTEQRALVCALQQNPDDVSRRRIRNYILSETRPDDFGSEEAVEIRKRMDTLIRNGRDLGDVATFLDDPTLSGDAQEFLKVSGRYRRKATTIPFTQVKRIVTMLHEYRKSRALYHSAQQITELCTDHYTDTTFQQAEEALLEAVKAIREDRTKKLTHIGRTRTDAEALEWFKNIMRPRPDRFVSTGLAALDQHMKGYQRGNLVVISAPSGSGKTALLLQAAVNQFTSGLNVGIASLEMNEEHLWERVIANVTDTDFWKIRLREINSSQEMQRLWRRWKRFERETAAKHNNFFTPWDIKDPEYMPANIELDLGPFGYDIIYVDYISLFGSGKKDLWAAQKDHGRHLKSLAGRLDCVVVALTQLSKDERVKYGTGPEEDADYWLWWRYGDEEVQTNKVELRLQKARHAKRCIISAEFKLSKMQIETKGQVKTAMSSFVDNKKKKQQSDKDRAAPDWKDDSLDLDPADNPEDRRDPEPSKKRRQRKSTKRRARITGDVSAAVEDELGGWSN